MKKALSFLLAVAALAANAAQTMRVCEPPTSASAPTADDLQDVGQPMNYSALCGTANFRCKDVALQNFDQPGAHCFVITAKHGQIPQPQDIGQAAGLGSHRAAKSTGPEDRFPQLVPVK